jgi:hypothetical protein
MFGSRTNKLSRQLLEVRVRRNWHSYRKFFYNDTISCDRNLKRVKSLSNKCLISLLGTGRPCNPWGR